MHLSTQMINTFGIKLIRIALLAAFMVAALFPHSAIAFEAQLTSSPAAQFIAQVELSGRDPYLAQAANSLPNYQYSDTGSIASGNSPITKPGDWTSATKLAFVPTATGSLPNPILGHPVVLEGEASYYSRQGCLGCSANRTMANGQPLNDSALTMAIGADKKHLVGHQAQVTNLNTGQSVNVTITDTGGFYQAKYGQRVADLTIATKQAIGMNGGVGSVRVEVY